MTEVIRCKRCSRVYEVPEGAQRFSYWLCRWTRGKPSTLRQWCGTFNVWR
jgi:hypothetical protein